MRSLLVAPGTVVTGTRSSRARDVSVAPHAQTGSENIGRERVLSTPAYRVEALPDGGVLVLTRPTPADFASDDSRRTTIAQARVLAHLQPDMDMSYEEVLARLRARSAVLAPVARRWDPDIADLLERTMTMVPLDERAVETERLNVYRPPAVTEWRPADGPGRAAARRPPLLACGRLGSVPARGRRSRASRRAPRRSGRIQGSTRCCSRSSRA